MSDPHDTPDPTLGYRSAFDDAEEARRRRGDLGPDLPAWKLDLRWSRNRRDIGYLFGCLGILACLLALLAILAVAAAWAMSGAWGKGWDD